MFVTTTTECRSFSSCAFRCLIQFVHCYSCSWRRLVFVECMVLCKWQCWRSNKNWNWYQSSTSLQWSTVLRLWSRDSSARLDFVFVSCYWLALFVLKVVSRFVVASSLCECMRIAVKWEVCWMRTSESRAWDSQSCRSHFNCVSQYE